MKVLRQLPVYIALLTLCACSVSDLPFVYRPEFQQGTVLEAERVQRLEAGMSRKQVRFLLGTPDIQDPFRDNRWDYVYKRVPGTGTGGERESEQLTVYFDGDRLIGARGSFIEPDSRLARGVPGSGSS